MTDRTTVRCLGHLIKTLSSSLIFEKQACVALQEWLRDDQISMKQVLLKLGYFDSPSQLDELDEPLGLEKVAIEDNSLTREQADSGSVCWDSLDAQTSDLSANIREKFLQSLRPISERFVKETAIGSGGTSNVFRALDTDFECQVALKTLKPECSSSMLLFFEEPRLVASLDHAYIPSVFAIGRDEESPCFAMGLISGMTLKNAVSEPVDNEQLNNWIEILEMVCQALEHAHSNDVIHRDVKPENIFLGDNGNVKLGDWGHATRQKPSSKTRNSPNEPMEQIHGTLCYISPERLSNQNAATPAVDIYSLGVTLYYVLTQRLPFNGTEQEQLACISTGKFVPPRQHDSGIPKPLEAICLKAMSLNPVERYGSADELRTDLGNWRNDRAVAAFDTPILKGKRFLRRNSGWVSATAALLLCAVAVVWYQLNQTAIARDDVVVQRNRAELIAGQSLTGFGDLIAAVSKGPNSLAAIPNGQGLRKKMLTIAKEHLESLAQQNSDFVSPIPMAIAQSQLGRVNLELGLHELAAEQLTDSESLIKSELERDPSNTELLQDLAACLHAQAKVAANKIDYDTAVAKIESAIELRASLDPQPGSAAYEGLCANRALLGSILRLSGKLVESNTAMKQVADMLSKVDDSEKSLYLRELNATTNQTLGALAAQQGKLDEAEGLFLMCAESQEAIASELPWLQVAKHNLAMTHFNLGRLKFDSKKFEDAIERLEKAETVLRELVEENPGAVEFLDTFANCKNVIAHCYAMLGKQDSAVKALAEMFEIVQPTVSDDSGHVPLILTYCRARIFMAQVLQGRQNDEASESLNEVLELINRYGSSREMPPSMVELKEMAQSQLQAINNKQTEGN